MLKYIQHCYVYGFELYSPWVPLSISQFCNTIELIQYSGRSKRAWAFSQTVKKISKITYSKIRPAGSHFCSASCVWMNINRVTLLHNTEFIMFIFYLMVLSMYDLQKRLIRAAFWGLLQVMFMNDWKQTAQWLKLQERLLTIIIIHSKYFPNSDWLKAHA